MKKIIITTFLALAATTLQAEPEIGFINFKKCIEESQQGKTEKHAFEALKKQMSDTLEKSEKELTQMSSNLEDQDYLDGLSEKAELELKQKFQAMSQEYARYQNQYYQLLNQANYKMLQTLHDKVSIAAEKVRAEKELSLIINEDSAFAFAPTLDVTKMAIVEMDKLYELENKNDQIANLN